LSWLTKISLRNRSIIGLAVLAVLLVGAYAITSLKQELIPDLTFPYLTVFTVDYGSSPKDVERTITTPLEQAIKTSSGVKEYDSFSNDGMSIITIEYEFGTDIKAKEAEVQQAVSGVQQMLPTTAQAPQVAALNFNSMPVVQLAVSSSLPPQQLADLLGTRVVPRLQGIDGVQAVTLSGVQQMQLYIQLKPEAIQTLGVSPAQIMAAVTQANVTAGAGSVTSGTIVYPITVSATAQTEKALEDLVLPSAQASAAAMSAATGGATAAAASAGSAAVTPAPATKPVRLGDVATVKIAPAPLTAITRTNGKATIGISISKASTGNTVDIANAVADELPAISRDLGGKATITTVVDQSIFIKDSIKSLLREGLIGALFAIIVIWVFLRSWRSTLIAGLSIPLSVIGALIILWSRGDSLNMLTLGGLTIAIGRVIDDSIVVIENIYRHLQEGDSIRAAAYTGTREVAGAITASTLTTVAVFLPLGFVHGLASEFFRPFALTVTFALLCSLAVALMVVPVVATWLLSKRQAGHRDEKELSRLQNAYLPALNWALNHKVITLVAAVAVFAGTMMLSPLLKTNLFDSSGQNTMAITQTMPAGTSLDATMAAARKVEDVLKTTQGVDIYQVTGGSTGSLFGAGGGTAASASQATFSITTDPAADKTALIDTVRLKVSRLQNAGTITVSGDDATMGGGMAQMEVRVSAADPVVLKAANDIILARMQTVDGLADVTSNLSEGRPAATIVVDQAKAAAAGVTPAALSQYTTLVFNGYPLGNIPTAIGTLPAQVTVGEITVPPLPGAVSAMLMQLPVAGTSGMVPLGQIAKVVEVKAPVQVTHIDGARTASITGTSVDNNIGAASSAVNTALDGVKLPQGASWELGGATQATNDVFRSLGIAMLVAILLVYIIMVATFRSLLNPLILLISIPFAAVGAVIALVITGTSLGMPSMIGLLMLIGIVVTNAIVLLDLVEQFRRRGMDARTAVIEGGRRRLRPILMTAIATILALIPMALGIGGKGGFLSTPLAVVVIGGLFTSTFLTLILVPVLYLALDRLRPANAYAPEADDGSGLVPATE
jgi:hydrophobic/amphiphilic exporter-1 (mainly G- bacteria), HAE1 family